MSAREYGYDTYEQMIRHAFHHGGGVDLDYDGCEWVVKLLDGLDRAEQEANFCFVCGNHPNSHSADCPMKGIES